MRKKIYKDIESRYTASVAYRRGKSTAESISGATAEMEDYNDYRRECIWTAGGWFICTDNRGRFVSMETYAYNMQGCTGGHILITRQGLQA